MFTAVRPSGVEDASQFQLNIDWAKAGAVGVTAADVGTFLTTVWSSSYVNDFLYKGRMKRVYVQGEPIARTDQRIWHFGASQTVMANLLTSRPSQLRIGFWAATG